MKPIGLDIGTNYTKATKNGKDVIIFPSLVAFGGETDWVLKKSGKSTYVGDDALHLVQNLEDMEELRPIQGGRLIHASYIELAKHALRKLNVESKNLLISTGLPVKSSRYERNELLKSLSKALNAKIIIFPQPVGTLAYMDVDTGVCIDIGFGTTDVAALAYMEFLRGDTILVGVDKLYENLEITIRNKIGIGLTPEEITKLLTVEGYEVGRIRSGRKVSVSQDDIIDDYYRLMKSWIERISNRVKVVLEGLSTAIIDRIIATGGGVALPGVHEELQKNFKDVGDVTIPDDPIGGNVKGYYKLAKIFLEEKKKEEKEEKTAKEKKAEKRVSVAKGSV